ncbi:putative phage tail protein [Bacillus sp. AFS017336]|uniref:putative phage tail protein n=1 Tax=Bacillus sp. AFS017336 TaxID=2033489 RepID=UPI000BF006F4|nr:putative phage tail protein [Bacillus sp. AFS017336]PEL12659.1 phage portal protein [Bacillus sp. AFS017336]
MLRDDFPQFYENNGTMLALWAAEESEIDILQANLESTVNQMFIDTTDTEIARWETMFGLPIRPNIPLADRQSTVKAKIRGIGVVNVAQIKRTADAFTNGNVQVTEKASTYEFEIKFTAVNGTPPNMGDLQEAINQLKPAHLNVIYVYAYRTWNKIDLVNYTWNQIDALGLTWDQFETLL